ncbi:MAG: hypothetical protein ACE15C_03645 [Phycisphaerae bacterium]
MSNLKNSLNSGVNLGIAMGSPPKVLNARYALVNGTMKPEVRVIILFEQAAPPYGRAVHLVPEDAAHAFELR